MNAANYIFIDQDNEGQSFETWGALCEHLIERQDSGELTNCTAICLSPGKVDQIGTFDRHDAQLLADTLVEEARQQREHDEIERRRMAA